MKKIILILIVVLLSYCSTSDYKRPSSDLEDAIGRYWKDTAMALAIRNAESLDGKWTFRFENTNIYHEKWVQSIPGIKNKFRKYGWYIISSDGDWQIFYPTALYNGYKGSPCELQENIFTNAKYWAMIWEYYDRQYANLSDKISAYNHGSPWFYLDRHKVRCYLNWKYVELVQTNYRKWRAYERD